MCGERVELLYFRHTTFFLGLAVCIKYISTSNIFFPGTHHLIRYLFKLTLTAMGWLAHDNFQIIFYDFCRILMTFRTSYSETYLGFLFFDMLK